MMISKNIQSSLKFFGLDEVEIQAYVMMLKMGSIKVGNLARNLEIDRGKAYRTIKKLQNFGLISTTLSSPTICVPMEPKEALTDLIHSKENEILTMQNLSKMLIKRLIELKHPFTSIDVSSLSIIQGSSNIFSRIGKILEEAKDTVYIVTTIDDIKKMYYTVIPEKIKQCQNNDVEVLLLTEKVPDEIVPYIIRLGAINIRIGDLPSEGRMVVEKEKRLLMSGSSNHSISLNDENDSVLYTNSREMVDNMFSLCNHLWEKSAKIEVKKDTKILVK